MNSSYPGPGSPGSSGLTAWYPTGASSISVWLRQQTVLVWACCVLWCFLAILSPSLRNSLVVSAASSLESSEVVYLLASPTASLYPMPGLSWSWGCHRNKADLVLRAITVWWQPCLSIRLPIIAVAGPVALWVWWANRTMPREMELGLCRHSD